MKLNPVRLQAALKRSGMNQADLADKINVQRVTISRYINGHRDPHRIHLQRMAEALRVPEDYLTAQGDAIMTDEASLGIVIDHIHAHANGWSRKQKMGLIKLLCDFVG